MSEDWKKICKLMKECPPINHKKGIMHYNKTHKRIFHKLLTEHHFTLQHIQQMKMYMTTKKVRIYDAFKLVYNSMY